MTDVPAVFIDACVIANFSLCDTLLRLAEPPRLFEPKWSEEILQETVRVLERKLGWPSALTARLQNQLRVHFPEAWIAGFEPMVSRMTNDVKDRHVAAAAAHAGARLIVTFNLKHFRNEHLRPWGVDAVHPQTFLCGLYRNDPAIVMAKLEQQAADRGRSLSALLDILAATVPEFVHLLRATLTHHDAPM
jgi:predicted nucleic acid-binding protein